jgi:hypothetical protein
MPIYTVEGPDGRIYEVEGPEGASNAQVIAAVQRQIAAQARPAETSQNKSEDYAKWLRAHQDKKDTPDYQTVLKAFQEARLEELRQKSENLLQSQMEQAKSIDTGSKPVVGQASVPKSPSSVDLTSALGAAAGSTLIAAGVGVCLYRFVIRKNKGKSQRLLLIISVVAFCFGLAGSLNEIINSQLLDYSIRASEIYKFIIPGLLLPFFAWLFFKVFGSRRPEDAGIAIAQKSGADNSQNINLDISAEITLECWELALKEYEGEGRQIGLWGKLYAEFDGNESRVKADYLKIRAAHFHKVQINT